MSRHPILHGGQKQLADLPLSSLTAPELIAAPSGTCDVDWNRAAATFGRFERAKKYKDYRVLLEKENSIDAMMIATPDHMHAPITMAAFRSGKHVYVEKPMAHSIVEARVMTALAKETRLVTQMATTVMPVRACD